MWSYRITSKTLSNSSNTKSSKERAFERALSKCRFRVGNRVKIRGTPKKGTITIILSDINDIKWHGMMPQFIVVNVDNEGEILAAPVQLKGPIYDIILEGTEK